MSSPTPSIYLPTAMVHMGMNAVDNDTIVSQFILYISSNQDSYFFIFDKDVFFSFFFSFIYIYI